MFIDSARECDVVRDLCYEPTAQFADLQPSNFLI